MLISAKRAKPLQKDFALRSDRWLCDHVAAACVWLKAVRWTVFRALDALRTPPQPVG